MSRTLRLRAAAFVFGSVVVSGLACGSGSNGGSNGGLLDGFVGTGGNAGTGGTSGGGTTNGGTSNGGSANGGTSHAGSSGAGAQGGASSGHGGSTSGNGGASGGTGGTSGGAGAAGETSGSGGTTSGSAGTSGGTGGTVAGNGGSSSGASGSTQGQGGANAGASGAGGSQGGSVSGSGGVAGSNGGSSAGVAGSGGANAGMGGTSQAGGANGGVSGSGTAGGPAGTGGIPEMIGGGGAPATWTCNQDLAFWAQPPSVAYPTDDTPTALSTAITEASQGTRPISLVIQFANGSLNGGVSETASQAGGDVFPSGFSPTLVSVIPSFLPGAVTSQTPQTIAYLHLVDQKGAVDVALQHVIWTATQNSDCNDVSVDVQALIPASEFGVVLHTSSGNQSIGELSGITESDGGDCDGNPKCGGPSSVSLHITFHGTPMTFDFNSL